MSGPFSGVVVPMVTPVTPEGELDEPAVRRVVEHLLAGGVQGLFVLGTTGEGPSVPRAARPRLVRLTVESVRRRAVVYAGIGDTCLADSLAAAKEYRRLGVDAVVAHLPYYYPLDALQQLDYLTRLADGVAGPLLLYNIPPTVHMSLAAEVVEQLCDHPNVYGLKDSEYDQARLEGLLSRTRGQPHFSFLLGPSAFSAWGLARGADGIVPSTANLEPSLCQRLYEAGAAGEMTQAEELQRELNSVDEKYRQGRSLAQLVAGLKYWMSLRGLCGPWVLPPLQPLTAEAQAQLRERTGEGA